jgi:hypothetical protein
MLSAKKTTLASANRFASFAYKPEPKREREAPFGLQADTASLLGEILKKDNTLKESVTGLMSQAKASGTMESYERSTKKFEKFCAEGWQPARGHHVPPVPGLFPACGEVRAG